MNTVTVYLAGKMTGLTKEEMTRWRRKARELFLKYSTYSVFKVLDPTVVMLHDEPSDKEITASNKYQIRNSDIVLAEIDFDEISIGTIGEIVYAHTIGKPVIVWGKNERIKWHPWIQGHIIADFAELENAVRYIVSNFWR